jgi:ATP synthase protein I
MLANDARILVRSAVVTAITGAILIAIGAITEGGKGALGAAAGVALVAVFFTLSVVVVSYAGRRFGLSAMMGAALGIFVVKVVAVLALVAALQGTTAFNTKMFGVTAIICILAWSAGQIATLARRQMLYVEPDTTGTVPQARGADGTRRAGKR